MALSSSSSIICTTNTSVVFLVFAAGNYRPPATAKINTTTSSSTRFRLRIRALKETPSTTTTEEEEEKKKINPPTSSSSSSAEDITKKYGLEAGLWKIFSSSSSGSSEEEEEEGKKSSKGKGEEAKELLTKYGGAYLATSITLSLISFSLCYALITAGVDVSALLNKVGISTNETGEKLGTFALAYAAHKAASPIRFPPTVALTPIVASWINNIINNNNNT